MDNICKICSNSVRYNNAKGLCTHCFSVIKAKYKAEDAYMEGKISTVDYEASCRAVEAIY